MDQCTGCGACAQSCPQACIHFSEDSRGFSFPTIDQNACIHCGKCRSVCPVLRTSASGREPIAYAAYSSCSDTRAESSSGGIFSELAKLVLSRGGVVFGAAFDKTFSVRHICVENEQDLWRLRGAKYVQSDIGTCYKEAKNRLNRGQYVLFSGTPCQIAGLHSFLNRQYSNLLSVDIVCMGVPSPTVWQSYMRYREKMDTSGSSLIEVSFRSKESGWSRYQYSVQCKYADGTLYQVPNQQDLYLQLFTGRYLSRACCTNCNFKGIMRDSDITLGDFWGIWDIAPEMDDNGGTSVILVHTPTGDSFLQQLGKGIICKKMPLDSAYMQNPAIIHSFPLADDHDTIVSLALRGSFDKIQRILDRKQKRASAPKIFQSAKRILRRLLYSKEEKK